MSSSLRAGLLNNPEALPNVVAADADIEAQPPAAQQSDFNEIYTLIATTPALAADGALFTHRVQIIETATQELIELEAIDEENFTQLKQELSTLLTAIAPSITPYTGKGLHQTMFNEYAIAFLSHIENVIDIEIAKKNTPIAKCISYSAAIMVMTLMLGGFITLLLGTSNMRRGNNSEGVIETAVGSSALALLTITVCLTMNAYPPTPSPTETSCTTIKTTVRNIYSIQCATRKTITDFQNNASIQPNYFNELAAKLFANRLAIDAVTGFEQDDEKTMTVLREFSQINAPEGLKFNAMLSEDLPDNMLACIHQLLAITIIQTGDHQLTLQADHILGADAAQSLYDGINQLRSENGLEQWPAAELTNGVIAEEIKSKSEKESVFDNLNPTVVAELLEKFAPITLPASSLSNLTGPAQNPLLTINSAAAADVNDDEQAPVPTQATRILPLNITTSDTPVTIHAKALSASASASNSGVPLAQVTQMQAALFTESKTSDANAVAAPAQNLDAETKAIKAAAPASPKQ
jgi:hypothetical protein